MVTHASVQITETFIGDGQVDPFISHTFALDAVQEAWDLQATRECAKVILKPWG